MPQASLSSRSLLWVRRAGWIASLVLMVGPVYGKDNVDELSNRLRASSFRLRVQAALSLGASDSDRAVGPLCEALRDDSRSVRAAAGAALGKLQRADGLDCLARQLAHESNDHVRRVLQTASDSIYERLSLQRAAAAFRVPQASSSMYVGVAPTIDKSATRDSVYALRVQAAVRDTLLADPRIGVAPANVSIEAFRAAMVGKKLRGFLLKPTLDSVSYKGSVLTVSVRVTFLSYPAMVLLGAYTPTLSMSNTPRRDPSAEAELIRTATKSAVEKFLSSNR